MIYFSIIFFAYEMQTLKSEIPYLLHKQFAKPQMSSAKDSC